MSLLRKMAIVWFAMIFIAGCFIAGRAPSNAEQPEFPKVRSIEMDSVHSIQEVTIDGCQYLTATDTYGRFSVFTHKGNCKNHPGLRSKGE